MSGLDPFQLADVRDMILEAAHKRAILFSTHVVQEIEMLCNRSVFLKDGVLGILVFLGIRYSNLASAPIST